MPFLQPTFDSVIAQHPPPHGGSTPPSRYDPHDAIHTAAAYLCDSGTRDDRDLYRAIYAYNHADWYVRKVLDQAKAYKTAQQTAPGWLCPRAEHAARGSGDAEQNPGIVSLRPRPGIWCVSARWIWIPRWPHDANGMTGSSAHGKKSHGEKE